MIKAKLLSHGGYAMLKGVVFPVEVDVVEVIKGHFEGSPDLAEVTIFNLVKLIDDKEAAQEVRDMFDMNDTLCFYVGSECEVIND